MYCLANRFNNLLSIFSTALALTAVVLSYLSYSSYLSVPSDYFDESIQFQITDMKLSTKRLRSYGGSSAKPKENAKFKFDLTMDLSGLIDANTKQLFTYIYLDLNDENAKFANATTDEIFGVNDHVVASKIGTKTLGGGFANTEFDSKLIIWDHIFTDRKIYFNEKGLKSKYSVWDYSPELSGRTGQFKLAYNIQPWVGPLLYGEIDLKESVTLI